MTISVDELEKLLPQTQCGLCNYPGCRPYAQAIIDKEATIEHCAPGGKETLLKLANALEIDTKPYLAHVQANYKKPSIAFIREEACIGCTKCIQACPVDAIVGSAKKMHTILTDECTGCNLCVEPCPTDCIDSIELDAISYVPEKAYQRHQNRLQRLTQQTQQSRIKKSTEQTLRDSVSAAVARAKAKRAQRKAKNNESS